MFKTLVFMRGEVRVLNVVFESGFPFVVMEDGSRMPLNAKYLHHVEQAEARYYYRLEVLHP